MSENDTGTQPPGADGGPPSAATPGSHGRRVALNALSNWAALGIGILVNLFLVKYLFTKLGRGDFGICQVAVSVTQITVFLRFGLAGSVLRKGSEYLASRDWERLSSMMSVARTLLTIAGVLAWVVAVFASLFLLDTLKVPEPSRDATRLLIILTGVSAAAHIMGIVYLGVLRAMERYYLANAFVVGESLVRVGILTVAFSLGCVRLEMLGVAFAVPAVLMVIAAAVTVKRLLPRVEISFRRCSRSAWRELIGFSFWVALVNVAASVQKEVGPLLVSALYGVGMVPVVTVPQRVTSQFVRILSGLVQPVRPAATRFAVRGEYEKLRRWFRTLLRLTAVVVLSALSVLVAYGRELIAFLTSEQLAEECYVVLIVYVALMAANLLALPAFSIIMAVGRIRGMALSQAAAVGVGVGISVLVATATEWGVVGLVAALNGPLLFHNLGYVMVRIRQTIGVKISSSIIHCLVPPIAAVVVPLAVGFGLKAVWPAPNIVVTVAQMAVCLVAYGVVAWFLVLPKADRRTLAALIPGVARLRGRGKRPPAAGADRPEEAWKEPPWGPAGDGDLDS